jgi:geranylgeranyl diphosphate synthase type II
MAMPDPAMSPALAEALVERQRLVDGALERWLPRQEGNPPAIHEAMRYSVFAGGKRLRPLLTLFACEAVGGKPDEALPAAAALEMIHTYSLIHDDLPAMDDDDFRRGRPTCHKVYGEAIAILAGDALLTHAFQVLADPTAGTTSGSARLLIAAEIARAAGSLGMVGGQTMDILAEGRPVDRETLLDLHSRKTGALLRAAVRVGGIAGEASEAALDALTRYGERIGLAFQIVDDILDIEGDSAEMGKTAGSDLRKQKATYPAAFGLAESKRQATALLAEAKATLAPLGNPAWALLALADYMGTRRK